MVIDLHGMPLLKNESETERHALGWWCVAWKGLSIKDAASVGCHTAHVSLGIEGLPPVTAAITSIRACARHGDAYVS